MPPTHSEAHQGKTAKGLPSLPPVPIPPRGGGHARGQGESVAGAEGALPRFLSSAGRTPSPPQKEQNSLKIQLWRCRVPSRGTCAFVALGGAPRLPAGVFFPSATDQARCQRFGSRIPPPHTLLEGNLTSRTSPAPLPYAGIWEMVPCDPLSVLPRTVGP